MEKQYLYFAVQVVMPEGFIYPANALEMDLHAEITRVLTHAMVSAETVDKVDVSAYSLKVVDKPIRKHIESMFHFNGRLENDCFRFNPKHYDLVKQMYDDNPHVTVLDVQRGLHRGYYYCQKVLAFVQAFA